jgi:two-component system sensor histidine kinase ChvG
MGWRTKVRRFAASLTLKLVILLGIFVALPVVLYGQFESADRQMRQLVTRAIEDRSQLIADALKHLLQDVDPTRQVGFSVDLGRHSSDGTVLKLMFHPTSEADPDRFFFVASGPKLRSSDIGVEIDQLRQRGILQRLTQACILDSSDQIRYRQPDGSTELLTSIIPIRTNAGCWVLTSTHTTSEFLNTSIGRPYWETREIRFAAAIYVVLAVVALLVAISIRLSLRRFRDVAAEISQGRIGDYAFSHRNVVPELSSVARDFDKLVLELARASQQIRQSAEDKAHSFKTPLAAIRSALEPVRRAVPLDSVRARRALDNVDSSLNRLLDLVIAAQRLDMSTAELIDSPRLPTDFTQLVAEAALHFREILAAKDVRLIRRLDEDAIVRAGRGMLEVVLQNVLENAISFSPRGGTIVVTLMAAGDLVELQVDDEGPGVPPEKLDHMFERYFSSRPRDSAEAGDQASGHAGLGLWIVKRYVEALGGRIEATNRLGGGLCVTVTLPRSRA